VWWNAPVTSTDLGRRVAELPWYHSIELPGGVVTPGEYDHRPIVGKIPLPARLDGLRCLDLGTHDGFWAFEMERRGAAEVVGIDVERAEDLDWPEPRPVIDDQLRQHVAARKQAFAVAKEALGSQVERRYTSIYDLDPADIGRFDVAFLGTLLHHLRDPVGALQSVRRVVDDRLVLLGVFSPLKSALLPLTPVTELLEHGSNPFFEMPNLAGLRRQLQLGGWQIERWGRPHLQPYGAGWRRPALSWRGRSNLRTIPRQVLLRRGALHISVVARPVR
jgi:tRNA (mo5U34)-methyltransferase